MVGMSQSTHASTEAATTEPATSDPAPRATENRSTTPGSDAFRQYIGSGWAERPEILPGARRQAEYAAARRARVSDLFPGKRLIIPAGRLKQRSNDTDYPFRAHSAFAHLTGWGSDSEPGSVLVLEPTAGGHEATLYFRERAGRDSDEFYANPEWSSGSRWREEPGRSWRAPWWRLRSRRAWTATCRPFFHS